MVLSESMLTLTTCRRAGSGGSNAASCVVPSVRMLLQKCSFRKGRVPLTLTHVLLTSDYGVF